MYAGAKLHASTSDSSQENAFRVILVLSRLYWQFGILQISSKREINSVSTDSKKSVADVTLFPMFKYRLPCEHQVCP